MESPSLLTVESSTYRAITLSWVDAEDAEFYRVYFGKENDRSLSAMGCLVMQGFQRAMVRGLDPDTEYFFWVISENDYGELGSPVSVSGSTTLAAGKSFEIYAVQDAVYEWAVNNFGDYAVIWENENGTKPAKPFVSLTIKSGPPFGGNDHVRDGNRLCGNRLLMVSVCVYSDDAIQNAMDLRTSLQLPTVIDFFDSANIGLTTAEGVNDLTQLLDNDVWESRAQFDFGILVASEKSFDSGDIAEVQTQNNIGR